MKAIYLIGDGFRPEEYFQSREVLEENGMEVFTAGARRGTIPARDIPGQPKSAQSDMDFNGVNLDDYIVVVVPGGSPGWQNLLKNDKVIRLLKQADEKGMLVASICSSVAVLAKAGILKGKKATIWPGQDDDIKRGGGIPVDADEIFLEKTAVVKDGNILTANGPWASREFGRAIVKALA
ncbi:MAG: hypothetical protein MSIBF_05365 [Candidatus Altiarchaeales archaeon IMC4]|nr:MAG: hypothetical protein MSIBF_05365 [Candidatus Altiarchaeales archaeon IMC4]